MPILSSETPHKRGAIRGRESRNHTLTTKLTEAEQRAVEATAGAEMKTTGEWLRDLALRAIDENSDMSTSTVALPEIIGVRLLLVNVLRTLATGQRLTPEAFDKLLDEIGTAKYELAGKLVSERKR
ncbi:MAG TPA: hypothetical protein VM554_13815 [Acidisarcina sp.]|nr:hypothetical protein [Acidisarcina sp.]